MHIHVPTTFLFDCNNVLVTPTKGHYELVIDQFKYIVLNNRNANEPNSRCCWMQLDIQVCVPNGNISM